MVCKSELKIKVNIFIDLFPHSSEDGTWTPNNGHVCGIYLSLPKVTCAAHKCWVDMSLFPHSLYGHVWIFLLLIVFAL